MISSEQVRDLRDEFWQSKNHKLLKPSSLVSSSEDKTVLFNIAWMQQLVPYLSWKPHPLWKRLYNIQRCIRTNDIDEVWDNTHCTFFEMMWNWSLWDYFKKESLTWSVEFLTQKLWLEFDKLGFTIFGGLIEKDWKVSSILPFDQEAKNVLLDLWVKEENIQLVPMYSWKKCDNFRGPAWKIWPCWPSCEIYYDKWDDFWPNDKDFVNNDSRYVEIWNNVFMQYYKDKDWNISLLENKNIDTWMWLERLMTFLQNKKSVYETDLFEPLINTVNHLLSQQISIENKNLRIVVEHLRSVVFLLADWVIPSNEWRGYVARRLLRRMWFHFKKLSKNRTDIVFVKDLVFSVVDKYWKYYPHLKAKQQEIIQILQKEISNFEKTLKKWEDLIFKEIQKQKNAGSDIFEWKIAFKLYDTYWFPFDLTRDLVLESWLKINEYEFNEELSKAKIRSKQKSSQMFNKNIDWALYLEWIEPTEFVGYEQLELSDFQILKEFEVNWQKILIFDKTPFYAESWWQIGDKWIFIDKSWKKYKIIDVKKYEWVFLHFVE